MFSPENTFVSEILSMALLMTVRKDSREYL